LDDIFLKYKFNRSGIFWHIISLIHQFFCFTPQASPIFLSNGMGSLVTQE